MIKERKKEEKVKKREEVKAPTPAAPAKTQSRKAQEASCAAAVKTQQTAKRNAIVSKNRGLPVVPAAATNNASKNAKKAAKKTKTKTSITEVTAQLRHKMRVAKNGGQQRTSIKSAKKALAQPTTNSQRVVRKQDKLVAKKPSTQTNQKVNKQALPSADANLPTKTKERSVVRADSKKGKLKITISAGNNGKSSRSKNANASKRQQTPGAKKVLPGKVNAKARKQQTSQKKTGKQSKKSRKHQATASVVVRQPFASRKKN